MTSNPTINSEDFKKLRPAFIKKFDDIKLRCVDFSRCGNYSLCSDSKSIKIYKLDEDVPKGINITPEEGIGLVKFHKKINLIHTTNKNGVKYFDCHNNKYVIKFSLGSYEITHLAIMQSSENHFATAAVNAIRIWDLRRHDKPLCYKNFDDPLVACHPLKRDLAIAYKKDGKYSIEICEYLNLKCLKKFEIENKENYEWTELKFSDDGKIMLASTRNSVVLVIDVSDGKIVHELVGFDNLYNNYIDACFTPCSKFVVSGSHNSIVHFWDLNYSDKLCTLKNKSLGPIHKLAFNSKFMCLATAGEEKFCIWVENDA